MSQRAAPFYCPYCGETSIEPIGDHGDWVCEVCTRRFTLSFKGLGEAIEQSAKADS